MYTRQSSYLGGGKCVEHRIDRRINRQNKHCKPDVNKSLFIVKLASESEDTENYYRHPATEVRQDDSEHSPCQSGLSFHAIGTHVRFTMSFDSSLWFWDFHNNGDVSCHDEKKCCEIQSDEHTHWIFPACQSFRRQLKRKTNWWTTLESKNIAFFQCYKW